MSGKFALLPFAAAVIVAAWFKWHPRGADPQGPASFSSRTASAQQEVPAHAGDAPGHFDYWVLALSWSPHFCAQSAASDEAQCAPEADHALIVHGLWPQYEDGWPEYCSRVTAPPEDTVSRMESVMPSRALVIHEWRKHGSCSGLPADRYFQKTFDLYRGLSMPTMLSRADRARQTNVRQIEEQLIAGNPSLTTESIAVQCDGEQLDEIRICYDKNLEPRACGERLRDACPDQIRVEAAP